MYEIKCPCADCGSQGTVTFGNPNNPSARLIDCYECEGKGYIILEEEYDNRYEAFLDYKNALTITKTE